MVEISGVVVDEQGKPIPDVHIMHAGVDFKTRADGTFRVSTSSPFVVFRHQSFASVVRRPGELKDVRIQMSTISLKRFPGCNGHKLAGPINPVRISFEVPDTPGISRLDPTFDVDYAVRPYRLRSNRSAVMQHGRGYAWSLGFPLDPDVWASVEYDESVFELGAIRIVDARGMNADGRRWRFLGRLTETISYGPLPPEEAAIFDRAIDGVCVVN